MKRFFKTLLVLLLVLMPVTFASAKKTTTTTTAATSSDKITLYVFYGDGCPHCAELEEFIMNSLKRDSRVKDFLNVVYYETWYDTTNQQLLGAVGSALNTEVKGVPFAIVGDQYFSGYGSSMNDEIVNKILEVKNSNKNVDVVAQVIEQSKITPNPSNPEAGQDANSDEKDDSKKNDVIGIVILGVTVVIILAILFTKHSDDSDEDEKEDSKASEDEDSEEETDEDEDLDDEDDADDDSEEETDDEAEVEEEVEETKEVKKASTKKKSSKKKKSRK